MVKIYDSEYRFCLLLWEHEPINSTKLAALCKEQLGWSKATTYTVIRRLSERGIIKNENATVSSLIAKEEAQQAEMEELLEKTFEGSLPAFLVAFGNCHHLSEKEIRQLEMLIHSFQEDTP